jgi:enolase
MDSDIKLVKAREVLDSRGLPTVEVEVILESGLRTSAISPSGTSTGKYEAQEKRDGDSRWYEGKGVSKAVSNVNNEICSALTGKSVCEQEEIDSILCKLDGTSNKSRLGANAIVATSYAVAKASAKSINVPLYRYLACGKVPPLPLPWLLIIGGGIHSGGTVDFQEFLVAPVCATSYRECFYIAWKIHRATWKILSEEQNYGLVFSLSGGLAPVLSSNEEAISILIRAIKKAGYTPGKDILIYIDVAASSFFSDGRYVLFSEKRSLLSSEMIDYLDTLIQKYPIYAIEDGMEQEDWIGWSNLTSRVGKNIELVGDDVFVTNPERLRKGIREGVANAVLIKVNQIGTITEALKTVELAKKENYQTVISARSGESEDPIIAHLSIGFGVDEGKVAGIMGAESTGILNEFIRIEENLGDTARYLWVKK